MPRLPVALAGLLLVALPVRADGPPSFDRTVAPLLAAHCLGCHSGPKPRGELDLTRKETALAAGVVTPGKPADSSLWTRVAADEMPPKKPLSAADKAVLKAWIEGGAAWGTNPVDPLKYTTATRAGADWWSLRPVVRPPVPAGAAHPVDEFVRAKLRERGLAPSPEADRRTLIRRLSFDLVGLPPTAEDVEAFAADQSPDAYERLVDRMLASPHYGERWARHWLDVVRFGESDGFERNEPRPAAWHYRDWVIRALNADVPYDRFARMQLAGDVLTPGDPDGVKAAGYLVAGVHNTVLPAGDVAQRTARQDELEDIVGNIGQTFLGLSTHCARCHDHKFDPVPARDFYRLAAAVAGVTHGERPAHAPDLVAKADRAKAEVARLSAELATLEASARRTTGGPLPPAPVAAWDFRGRLPAGVTLVGGAELTPDGVKLDGATGFARTDPLPFDLRAKTLEAWVRLGTLAQGGGGVVSLQANGDGPFDAVVYAEREPGRWMAGSEFFRRTQPFRGPPDADADRRPVHVAITYAADGTVTGYRDGRPYGSPYHSVGPVEFRAGTYAAAFGIRHAPAGGNRMLAGTVVRARLYDRALSAAEVAASAGSPDAMTRADVRAALSPGDRSKWDRTSAALDAATAEAGRLRAAAAAKVYSTVPQSPPVTRVLVRGSVTDPAETVAAGGTSALPGAYFGLPPDAPDAARRRKLAEWVTGPANPLFARVMVNRLWHHHFGTGIVDTPSDFGFNGGRPSHPELLDWLAAEFAARGYSLKAMHKLLVTSAAYRQSSAPRKDGLATDADDRLLWRKAPRRLEAETVRDAMLAAAGLLNPEVGGQGFTDYKVTAGAGTTYYEPADPAGPAYHRRSVYRFTPRGGNPGLLDTFDCPDPSAPAPRRASTTTPLQALALWNGPFALRMAGETAARVTRDEPKDAGRQVDRTYRVLFQRDPTADERAAAAKLVEQHGLRALTRALLNSAEFLTVE